MHFDIYRDGVLVHEDYCATDEREVLALYAEHFGIAGGVRRDGAGVLYVGDATQGRYRARVARSVRHAARADWEQRYPGIPYGMPIVLAEAIKGVGGLQ